MKVDLEIVTLKPSISIVPPFDDELPELIPLLSLQVILYIIPLSPFQYIAPPSSPAVLCSKVELYILQSFPCTYIAAPSPVT